MKGKNPFKKGAKKAAPKAPNFAKKGKPFNPPAAGAAPTNPFVGMKHGGRARGC